MQGEGVSQLCRGAEGATEEEESEDAAQYSHLLLSRQRTHRPESMSALA